MNFSTEKIFFIAVVIGLSLSLISSLSAKAEQGPPEFSADDFERLFGEGDADLTIPSFVSVEASLGVVNPPAAGGGGGIACAPCCKTECAAGLECIGADTLSCDISKGAGVGQCQPKGSITLCPLSKYTEIQQLIDEIMKWVLIIALVIAPLMIVLGGFFMMTSRGDPKMSTTGKNIIKWAIVGLAVIIFAKAFISVIRYVLK